MKKHECLNCGHAQEVNKTNIYQDVKGKYTVCENCDASYDVEVSEEY
ncbi:hypothetical protein [Bacillus thuringiensis]|nr:hypothetical protein [Bacillus thuringiensis]